MLMLTQCFLKGYLKPFPLKNFNTLFSFCCVVPRLCHCQEELGKQPDPTRSGLSFILNSYGPHNWGGWVQHGNLKLFSIFTFQSQTRDASQCVPAHII